MTKTHWFWLLFFLSLSICLPLTYLLLISGFVDDTFIVQNRANALDEVEMASESDPPNIETLVNTLNDPDWSVSATAAERLGQLWQSGNMENDQVDLVVHSLLAALASGGHWWRFGWDKEEPEYEQFRNRAIEAVSKYGAEALPALLDATNSNSPHEREAACWITFTMFKRGWADQANLTECGIFDRIENLAKNDSNENVKSVCFSARNSIAGLQSP